MRRTDRKRYTIYAKRKHSNEEWTDWTDADDYQQATNHACNVERAGYLAKIVINEKQIEELRDILNKTVGDEARADAIFDAGFRNNPDAIRGVILLIDQMICCHANGDIDDERLYTLFDKFKKKHLGGENG